MINKTNNIHMM